MRPSFLLIVLLALAATSAQAQVYKWVDERGVVTYSNQKPMNPESVKKFAVVEEKVSFYSPDNALLKAIEANRATGSNLSSRVADLERQLDAERRARQQQVAYAAAPQRELCTMPAAECAGLVDSYNYSYGYPAYPYTVVAGGRYRPWH